MAQINKDGEDLVISFEQYREFAYPDPASPLARATKGMKLRWGFRPAREIIAELDPSLRDLHGNPWTCGIGRTRGVTIDTRMSQAQAMADMRGELEMIAEQVLDACTATPNENELAAMSSFAYNVGVAGFKKSTVLKCHNRGDKQAAARAFGLWVKAGGVEVAGLTRRRAAESALYLKPVAAYAPDTEDAQEEDPGMPQSVDAERPLTQSSINRSAVVAGGTAAVASVAETARTVADVKYSVGLLGDWLVPILLIIVVALCGYIVWSRLSQRKGGRA